MAQLTMFHVLCLYICYSFSFYCQLNEINKQGIPDHAAVIINITEYLLLLLTLILYSAFGMYIYIHTKIYVLHTIIQFMLKYVNLT